QRRDLAQVERRQDQRAGVDVVEDDGVDADGRVRTRVVVQAPRARAGQLVPPPERAAGIAALDAAVQVVPVIEHAQAEEGAAGDGDRVQRRARLQDAQEMEYAVEDARLVKAGDHERAALAHRYR